MRRWGYQYHAQLLGLCLFVLALTLSCSAGAPRDGHENNAELASPAFELPAPSTIQRNPSYVDSQRTLEADYYTHIDGGGNPHISVDGTDLIFTPEWTGLQPNIEMAARIGYTFDIPGYYLPAEVNLHWVTPPDNPDNLWIGAANWGKDRWDWYQATSPNADKAQLNGLTAYQSAEGILIAVVLLGTSAAKLDWIRVGPQLWSIEQLSNTGDIGQYSSLALDSGDRVRIACYDAVEKDLLFYFNDYDGLDWQRMTVDASDEVGAHACLALADNGMPGITYFKGVDWQLKYAYFGSSSWHTEILDSTIRAGWASSLKYDAGRHPHIAYITESGAIRYAVHDGSSWSYSTVDGDNAADISHCVSLVLPASGIAHVAYSNTGVIKYAVQNGGSWDVETAVTGTSKIASSQALALRASGDPLLVAYDQTNLLPKFFYKYAGTWSELALPYTPSSGAYIAMALDAQEDPRLAFYGDGLEYCAMEEGTWKPITVDKGWTGHHTSIAIDSNGYPCISYYDPDKTALMFARYLGD